MDILSRLPVAETVAAAHEEGLKVVVRMPQKAALLVDPKAWGANRVEYTGEALQGDKDAARLLHAKAVYLSEMVQAYGYEQDFVTYFDTTLIRPTDATASLAELQSLAAEYELSLAVQDEAILVTITEQTDLDEMNALIAFFAEGAGGMAPEVQDEAEFEGLSVIED